MAVYTERLSEALAVIATTPSAAQTASTVLTEAISMASCRRFIFIVNAGTPGSSGTIDFKVRWSATSGGTYADVAGAAITQLTALGVGVVEVAVDQVQALNPTAAFLKGSLTVGTATSPTSVVVLGAIARNEPANALNKSYVATPVVVS